MSSQERLHDLLADRALVGLDPAADAELEQLLAAHPEARHLGEQLELAAAAVAIAGVTEQGLLRMPDAMLERLADPAGAPPQTVRAPNPFAVVEQTEVYRAAPNVVPLPSVAPALPRVSVAPPPPALVVAPSRGPAKVVAIAGWLAAAACLLLAVSAYYFRPRTQVVTVSVPTPAPSVTAAPVPTTPAMATPAQERERLLAEAGTARLEWKKNPKDPASKAASGDVVWNAAEQRGYMRFNGLAKNDKRANVYQLWIFDKQRDDKYPVDGGVFTVDEDSGDVIVPIKARLPVGEVALFAVTVEKPGGVVVSKRERIVVTAKPG